MNTDFSNVCICACVCVCVCVCVTSQEESSDMLVCTVGELRVWPGASNVIPGQTQLSIDIRAQRDELREDIVSRVWHGALDECTRRGVSCELRRTHDAAAVQSDAGMVERAKRAILKSRQRVLGGGGDGGEELTVESVPVLVSGAGHDGLAMAEVTKVRTRVVVLAHTCLTRTASIVSFVLHCTHVGLC